MKITKEKPRSYWIKKLDKLISERVRNRDNWTCRRCFKKYAPPTNILHCSHFFSRRFMGTRFELDNLISLCYGCHRRWEGMKGDEYRDFMITTLGETRLEELKFKSQSYTHFTSFDLQVLYNLILSNEN